MANLEWANRVKQILDHETELRTQFHQALNTVVGELKMAKVDASLEQEFRSDPPVWSVMVEGKSFRTNLRELAHNKKRWAAPDCEATVRRWIDESIDTYE